MQYSLSLNWGCSNILKNIHSSILIFFSKWYIFSHKNKSFVKFEKNIKIELFIFVVDSTKNSQLDTISLEAPLSEQLETPRKRPKLSVHRNRCYSNTTNEVIDLTKGNSIAFQQMYILSVKKCIFQIKKYNYEIVFFSYL